MQNNLDQLMQSRHCKRSFLDTPVPRSILESVLQNAGHAASSKNTQPWQVSVLTGDTKQTLVDAMCQAFDKGVTEPPDYAYSMDPLPDTFKDRARACGYALYQLKGIERSDSKARTAHFRENYTFFGAPVAFIFHLPMASERGNFLDMGLFMQNVMLGLVDHGLGSCPQFSICSYSKTIRRMLDLGDDRLIVCGMSVGYPDDAKVNTFIPDREPLDAYTQWFD